MRLHCPVPSTTYKSPNLSDFQSSHSRELAKGGVLGKILIRTKCLQGHVLCMKSVSTSHHLMSLFVCLTYVKGECSIRSLLGLEPFGWCSIRPGSPTTHSWPRTTKKSVSPISFLLSNWHQRERERQEGNTMCVCKSPAVSSRGEYLSKSSETVCPEKHRQTAFYSPLVSSDPQPSALRQLVTRVPHFENTLDCNVFL